MTSGVEGLLYDKLCHEKKPRLHYDYFEEAAIAHDKIKKQGKSKSRKAIFKGLNQLVKFICYERGLPEEPDISKPNFQIMVLFPIIVFDGDMYEVKSESGEPKLEKTNHIIIRKNYSSLDTLEEADLEWIALESCLTLNRGVAGGVMKRWDQAFCGLHYVFGFHSISWPTGSPSPQPWPGLTAALGGWFARYMVIGHPIRFAWIKATQLTQPSITPWLITRGAYLRAEDHSIGTDTSNDHLPGHGYVSPDPVNPSPPNGDLYYMGW